MQPNNQGSQAYTPTTITPAINAWSAEYIENWDPQQRRHAFP